MGAKNPVIIVGTNALNRTDGSKLHGLCATISNSLKSRGKVDAQWRILNVLHRVCLLYNQFDLKCTVFDSFTVPLVMTLELSNILICCLMNICHFVEVRD